MALLNNAFFENYINLKHFSLDSAAMHNGFSLQHYSFVTNYPCSQKEIAMSFTRPMNVFLVCAAFAFVASMVLGIVP